MNDTLVATLGVSSNPVLSANILSRLIPQPRRLVYGSDKLRIIAALTLGPIGHPHIISDTNFFGSRCNVKMPFSENELRYRNRMNLIKKLYLHYEGDSRPFVEDGFMMAFGTRHLLVAGPCWIGDLRRSLGQIFLFREPIIWWDAMKPYATLFDRRDKLIELPAYKVGDFSPSKRDLVQYHNVSDNVAISKVA